MARFERDGQHLAANARRNHERPRLTAPPKSKPWSHQDDLKSLIGKSIRFWFVEPVHYAVIGKLIAADLFTLKVEKDDKSVSTYFKHSIVGYCAH